MRPTPYQDCVTGQLLLLLNHIFNQLESVQMIGANGLQESYRLFGVLQEQIISVTVDENLKERLFRDFFYQ